MAIITENMANEIADNWDNMAASEKGAPAARRETLRECADLIRMIGGMTPPGQIPREPTK